MKKRFGLLIFVALLLISVLSFTACGGSNKGGDSGDDIILTYYVTPSDLPIQVRLIEGAVFKLNIPHRDGYRFLGLFDDPDGGSQIIDADGNFIISIVQDTTLYAHWEVRSYTLSFDAGEGTVIGGDSQKTFAYGSSISAFPIAQRTGYDFLGWSVNGIRCSNADGTPLDAYREFNNSNYGILSSSSVTLSAIWEIKKVNITYDYNDGTYVSETVTVDYGDTLSFADLLYIDTGVKETKGWSLSSSSATTLQGDLTNITSDITLYAIWAKYRKVNFIETDESAQEIKVYSEAPYIPYSPVRNGYEFDGWYSSPSFSGNPVEAIYEFNANDTYYAKWNMSEYTLSFAGEFEDTLDGISFNIESSVLLPQISKEKYTFLGWCKNEDLSDTPMLLLPKGNYGDTTLYAKFKGDDRNVTLVADPATLKNSSVTVEYGTVGTLPVPEYEEYALDGWFYGDVRITDGSGRMLEKYLYDEDITLTAKYTKKYYVTVEIPYGAGSVEINDYYIEGEGVVLDFVQSDYGYAFDGFYQGSELITSSTVHGFYMPAENVSLKINLTPKDYILTLQTCGGYCKTTSIEVTYGEEYVLPIAYLEGYKFLGWYIDDAAITDADGVPLTVWNGISDSVVTAGYELLTEASSIIYIYDANSFLKIAENPTGEFVIIDDIDLSGISWGDVDFSGKLNGNGCSITGLTRSLFVNVRGSAVIKNLNVTVNVSSYQDRYFGIIAHFVYDSTVISKVKTYGSVNIVSASDAGGVVGVMKGSSQLESCENYASITGVSYYGDGATGGLVGVCDENAKISNSINHADVSSPFVGGVVAYYTSASPLVSNGNCGTVTGDEYAGGIAGYLTRNTTFDGCYLDASVNGSGRVGKYAAYGGYTLVNCRSTIKTTEEFVSAMKFGTVSGEIFDLMADIDMSGIEWTPVAFNGTFNGNGYSIKNLTVSSNTTEVGLFSSVSGTVSDLTIDGASISCGASSHIHAAVLTSTLSSGSISGVKIKNSTVELAQGVYGDIGGVVGYVASGTVSDCEVNVTIIGNNSDTTGATGGVVGWLYNGTLTDSVSYGSIKGTHNTGGVLGGLTSGSIISDLKNYASVEGRVYTGGVVGSVGNANALNGLYNAGSVVGKNNTGGIVGYISYGAATVSYSSKITNAGSVTGENNVGGIFGYYSSYSSVGYSNSTNAISFSNMTNEGEINGVAYVGGIVGYMQTYCDSRYTGWIRFEGSNLKNTGDISAQSYVGGLFGYAYADSGDSFIKDCSSSADITAAQHVVGGLAGELNTITVDSCSNEGSTVTNTGHKIEGSDYYAYMGGYVGLGHAVVNCVNNIEINYEGEGAYVGGFVGYARGVLQNCTNNANITASKASQVGGIAGRAQYGGGSLTYNMLYNNGDINAKNFTGGIVGYFYSYTSVGYNNHTSVVTMTTLENTGDISGKDRVGGIIAYFYINVDSNYTGWSQLVATSIKNEANITGAYHVGGLIGQAYTDNGESRIADSSSKGHIKAEYLIGGLAGKLENVQITNCSNEGTTLEPTGCLIDGSTYYAYIGGYVGQGHYVSGCVNSTEINYSEKAIYVGGIAGYANGVISDCENTADINAPNASYVGGLVGRAQYGGGNLTMQNLTNSGSIAAADYVGGIVGYFYSYASVGYNNHTAVVTMTTVKNTGDISANAKVAGIIGYFYFNVDSNYTGWGKLVVTGAKNEADITGKEYVGGLFGYAYSDNGDSKISDSSSSGQIEAEYLIGGLAGKLENVQLYNCSNEGTTIKATGYLIDGTSYYAYVGGYAGFGYYITECDNATEVEYKQKAIYVGGIAGYANGVISDCENTADINAPSASYVGGLVGCAKYGGGSLTMQNLTNSGSIAAADYVGGIVGYFHSYASVGYNNHTTVVTMTTVKNTGDISANAKVAGIIGYFYFNVDSNYTGWGKLVVTGAKNEADITGKEYVGGLFGYAYSDNGDSKISDSSSSGHIEAEYYIGGIGGRFDNIQLESCSNEGTTIKATGYLIDGTSYYAYVGGYAGYGYTVTDCHNATDIEYPERGVYVGGILGFCNGHIYDSSNSASVNAPKAAEVGGIAGRANYGNADINFKNLTNSGDVTGLNRVGGIIGYFYSYASVGYNNSIRTVTVLNNSNTGDISGASFVGGIFGYYYARIDSNYTGESILSATVLKNEGNMKGVEYVGGIFGYAYTNSGTSALSGGSSSGHVEGEYYVGGLAGKLENVQLLDCSNEGTTITATGYLVDGSNYYAFIGGYVGYGYYINGCKNSTEIVYNERGVYVGGIAGFVTLQFVNCENTANITAPNASQVGGIVGRANYSSHALTFENVKNSGNVTGKDYVGGIIGYFNTVASVGYNTVTSTMTFKSVDNSGDVSGAQYVAGIVGYYYGRIDSNYTGWTRLIGSLVKNTGSISGANVVGGLFGYLYTDTTSEISNYETSGAVSATEGSSSDTVAESTTIVFNE